MTSILLSPIGRSPGAVTGLYYALQEREPPVSIDTVILVTTAMQAIRDSAKLVLKDLGKDRVHLLRLRAENRERYTPDFDNQDAMLDFIMQVNAVLAHARKAGNHVYLGISGGRSSMGALLTLSAYVYGAAGIYHLWVEKWFEDHGDVYDPEVRRTLHPPANQRKLLGLPLASFDQFWDGGQLGQALAERPDARKALLRAVTDVDTHELEKLRQQRAASFKEVVVQLREIIRATEIEDATEAVIKVVGGVAKPIEWEVQLQQQLKPKFFRRIKKLFSDEENLKSAAGFVVKSAVEIAKPLAVAGLAEALGLDLGS